MDEFCVAEAYAAETEDGTGAGGEVVCEAGDEGRFPGEGTEGTFGEGEVAEGGDGEVEGCGGGGVVDGPGSVGDDDAWEIYQKTVNTDG